MSNNKQSSVEWYANEEDKLFTSYQKGFMSTARYILLKYKLSEQAKAMHKDEIESTYDDAIMKGRYQEGVEYYKEKFGGNK